MQSTSTPSALSRILRLLHHRPRARCTAGGHADSAVVSSAGLRGPGGGRARATNAARGARTDGLAAPSVADSGARGSGRWGFCGKLRAGDAHALAGWCARHEHGRRRLFVEREPRAAPPHAGCCARGRLRQRSRQLLRSIGAPPLAHSAARCPAARRSSAGTMEPGESWAGQWPLQRRRVRGAHSWRILFFRGGTRCAGAFYAPVRQPPVAEVGDAG